MIDLIISGLANGASVALLAVGFYISYCLARTFHLALGAVYAVAPFVAWQLRQTGMGLLPSACVAIATAATLSLLCEVLNHGPLRKRGASPEAHLLSSLGLYVVIIQAILLIWGPEARILRPGIEPSYVIRGITVRQTQLVTFVVALGFLFPSWAVMALTRVGPLLRAFRDNPAELALLGFNTTLIRRALFTLAGGFAAVSALVAALDGGFQAYHGFPSLLLAVVATLSVRGDGVGGPIIGGLFLGVVRTLCVWAIGARWQDTLSYALFVIALLLQQPRLRRVVTAWRPLP